VLVFVDRYNVLGAFHACQVLDSAADATGDVEGRFHGFPRLPNLITIGQPASVDNSTRSSCSAAQCSGEFFYQVKVLRFAQASPTTHDDTCILQRWTFALHLYALQYFHLE